MKVAMQCPECHSNSGLDRVRRRWHEKSLTTAGHEKLQCPDCQAYFMRGLGQPRLLYIGTHDAVTSKAPEFEC